MKSIDLTPLYRNSIGYDGLGHLLDTAMNADPVSNGYPRYDIEVLPEDRYAIKLAVAGFTRDALDIQVEKAVLTVRGKGHDESEHNYLYHGIANRDFERKFNLADYIVVTGAELKDGLLTIDLVKEVPEAMKPQKIAINQAAIEQEH